MRLSKLKALSLIALVALVGPSIPVALAQPDCVDYGEGTVTYLGRVDTPGRAYDVAVVDEIAYVADERNGLYVLDVSDPTAPVPLGGVATPYVAATIVVRGEYAYVSDWRGLQIIDISDPTAPVIAGTLSAPGSIVGTALEGDLAYLAASSELLVADISDPTAPVVIGRAETLEENRSVSVAGTTAYVCATFGLQTFDVSDPTSPQLIGYLDTPGAAHEILVIGDRGYLADLASLLVLDVSDPTTPTIIADVDTPGSPISIAVEDSIAYLAVQFHQALAVVDLTNRDAPEVIGSVDTDSIGLAARVADGRVYLADRDDGLYIFPLQCRRATPTSDDFNPAGPQVLIASPWVAASPNPYSDVTRLTVALPSASTAWLEGFDVSGRRVSVRDIGMLGAGAHVVAWEDPRPGVWFVRVRAGSSLGTSVGPMVKLVRLP